MEKQPPNSKPYVEGKDWSNTESLERAIEKDLLWNALEITAKYKKMLKCEQDILAIEDLERYIMNKIDKLKGGHNG